MDDGVREATSAELERWDATAVDGPGGHVLQSRAWAAHRQATGWTPHHLVTADGMFVLAVSRSWPFIGGGSAYLPRGPVADVVDLERLADRLAAVTAHLAGRGIDVVASDAEVPAATGYGGAIESRGFHAIEEIQPSRHTMTIELPPGVDLAAALAGVAKQTRARIRTAETAGIVVRRYDARPPVPDADDGVDGSVGRIVDMGTDVGGAFEAFFDLESATAERRNFSLGPRPLFLAWWDAALRAGHLVYLEALDPADPDRPIGGLVLYRHGRRLSTVQSADRVELRRSRPGVLHLLRWRAIEQAIAEGRIEMDLGGVDVAGARRQPRPGEPMYGLYEHKASFGARWVELTGAHEKVIRGWRYAAGRATARVMTRAGIRS